MMPFTRVSAICAAAVALAAAAFAQAPGQVRKETRAPNQVVETGHKDDTVIQVAGQQVHIDPQTGRIRQPTPAEAAALAAALEQQFGKRVDGITVTYLANGGVAARLDESFMEAITITRRPDGSLQFGHTTGLDQASEAVSAASKEPAKEASPRNAEQPKPAAPKPAVEETE